MDEQLSTDPDNNFVYISFFIFVPYDISRQACLSWGALSGVGPLQVTSDVGHDEALVCPPAKTAGGGEAGRGSRQARMSDLVDSGTAEVK